MSKNFAYIFKDGTDLRMDSFSCKQSLHTLSLSANGFTFLTTSHLMLKLMFLFFNFQTCSLRVVEVLLCSNLKDDLCKLNLILNSFSVSPIYVSYLFEVVSVTAVVKSVCRNCDGHAASSIRKRWQIPFVTSEESCSSLS